MLRRMFFPPPLAGEVSAQWTEGVCGFAANLTRVVFVDANAPTLALPRKRGREQKRSCPKQLILRQVVGMGSGV